VINKLSSSRTQSIIEYRGYVKEKDEKGYNSGGKMVLIEVMKCRVDWAGLDSPDHVGANGSVIQGIKKSE
jgi:hypothetical protein